MEALREYVVEPGKTFVEKADEAAYASYADEEKVVRYFRDIWL